MKVTLLSEGARTPMRTDEYAAGYDLYAPVDFEVKPGRNVLPLDIKIELDPGTEGQIRPRSGFSLKGIEGVLKADLDNPKRFDADVILGTLDENYRGIVGVILKSHETIPFIIKRGTKVAQMVIGRYCNTPFEVVDRLSDTERGEGGFGHTGTM